MLLGLRNASGSFELLMYFGLRGLSYETNLVNQDDIVVVEWCSRSSLTNVRKSSGSDEPTRSEHANVLTNHEGRTVSGT
jgi:hypothetical protein